MATNYATPEGFVTERQIAYYTERARGQVGYITVEHTGILPQGKASPRMLLISSDEHKRAIQGLVDAVHEEGCRIVIQINHAGRQTSSTITGSPIVGPSPIPCPTRQEVPRELSVEDIKALTQAFADAARRVKEAGADGVELHMAHGYLLCSFLSPFSNKRTDAYGGDIQARARFPVEVLKAVREAVGQGFPIIYRISADEYVEGGLDIEQSRQIARILEFEGADALHVSACNAASGHLNHPCYYAPEGVFLHLAHEIKRSVNIPVIAVGRIRTAGLAEEVIREGRADLVSMGRALIADPHLPRKSIEGRTKEITPCISCNRCIHYLRKSEVRCAVNPEAGNELELRVTRARTSRKVWVVGGGPGGLKAAQIAALRGHQVTLFERARQLGGRMRLAAIPPGKEVINEFLDHLERRARELGVSIRLGTEFRAEMVERDAPHALILATGATSVIPQLKGIEESGAVTVDEALLKPDRLGKRVLIVGGGGVGAEVADFLSEKGKEVTLVEMQDEIAPELVGHLRYYLLMRLGEKGVRILTSCRVKELGRGWAKVEDKTEEKRLDGFDDIVLALSPVPNDKLAGQLRGKVPELQIIGDARQPREALEAVYEAQQAAIKI
jgi:2,4-dienoyl-CoA reductase-like NADH-dependent reductase (Old Yellow Enzyme family)/thioredoxin reductase